MDILQIIMLVLHITQIYTHKSKHKKYESSSSDETIENLLYFKDCQRKPKEQRTTSASVPLRLQPPPTPPPPPPKPDCPFPKMCCSLSCGNECGSTKEPSFMSRQMESIQNIGRQGVQPIQQIVQPRQPYVVPVQPQIRKRKKMKFPSSKMQLPIGSGRRAFGFTKEKIKTLISQDDDIRKILKDLVRITMQKVDLLDMINGRRSGDTINANTETSVGTTPEVLDEDYGE